MDKELKELNKKIYNLELAKQGILAEYQYVLQKKEEKYKKLEEKSNKNNEELEKEKEKEKERTEYYKKEFEEAVKKMEKYKAENEAIKNSRWWKLREKIKGKK